ncbi:septum formation initiator family protein [Streptomyces lydicamycinicus]|uniref:Putative cell division protein FtsL n=1 Tax=Streptomyces lydicamycinicus TaxID=1546107 RepID=A0A0P4RG45_9ACTN|nr:septum formation initiator family protein [Streptomyces lydicamycinicus]GAO12727.1 putative cell division protein FtsL [Streptomyces lydicamycinicus]
MKGQGPRGRQKRLAALFPSGAGARGTAARTPFVLLIVVLLGSGLITLLLLNSALNQGSFELSKLEKQTEELTDEQQALQQDVDAYSAPGALEQRARKLGMVPGGTPVFLLPDGTVRGRPSVAGPEGAPLSSSAEPSPLGPAARTALPRPAVPPVPALAGVLGPDSAPGMTTPADPAPSAAPASLTSPASSGSGASHAPAPAAAAAPSPTTSGR